MPSIYEIDFDEKSLARDGPRVLTFDTSKKAILLSFERACLDARSVRVFDKLCAELTRGETEKRDIDILRVLRGLTMEKKDIEHVRMVAYNTRLLEMYADFSLESSYMNTVFMWFMMYAPAGETIDEFISRAHACVRQRINSAYQVSCPIIDSAKIVMDGEIRRRDSTISPHLGRYLDVYLPTCLVGIVSRYLYRA